jgi:nucleotide-binding universal stress UspA family protein
MFKHLLVPLDGSLLAECVLPHVVALVRVFKSRVTLLRALAAPQNGAPVDPFDWQLMKAEAEAYLDSLALRLNDAGLAVESVVVEGTPVHSVVDYASANQVDLIVLSSHGKGGLNHWNIGGNAHKILLRSQCSTLLVRALTPVEQRQTELRYRRLLVPLDGSLRGQCVLSFVTALGHTFGAHILLAHVLRHPEMPRQAPLTPEDALLAGQLMERNRAAMVKRLEQIKAQLPPTTDIRLVEREDVAGCLHELAESEQADLMILSAHGYSSPSQWPYGSVTSNLITYGTAPLLIIQDLVAADRAPNPAEVALAGYGNHVYRVSERFQPN